jgi:hypothetical protein
MPFCPKCKYEYREGIKTCADCHSELVDTLDDEPVTTAENCAISPEETAASCSCCGGTVTGMLADEDVYECGHCNNLVSVEDTFCRNCGSIFEEEVKCRKHSFSEALFRCVICEQPLCEECVVEVSGKAFCSEHSEYSFVENCVILFSSLDESEVIFRKAILEKEGIPCYIDQMDAVPLKPIGAREAFFRLFVPFEHVLKAEELLAEK